MKKNILLSIILFISSLRCMYHGTPKNPRKLKYDQVTLTNNSVIPLELAWIEVSPKGITEHISHQIQPNQTITVQIGKIGGYYTEKPARIIYSPIKNDSSYKQEFRIDLPESPAFVFTVRTLADIMNNIWVPGVLTQNDMGNFSSFQYKNLSRTHWERILEKSSSVRAIKY